MLLRAGTMAFLHRCGGLAQRGGTCKRGWGSGCEIPAMKSIVTSLAASPGFSTASTSSSLVVGVECGGGCSLVVAHPRRELEVPGPRTLRLE